MGFVLSLLYFVVCYLTPQAIFGPLAAYRIELILALLVSVVSLPALSGSLIWKTPQSLALIGLGFAVLLSVLVGMRWAAGSVTALLLFIPNAFAYFLVCLHCNTKKRLNIIVLMVFFVCMFVMAHGYYDLQHGFTDSDYLMAQMNDAGQWIYRVRGLGGINDPNDFAQLIACISPLMFIFWRKRQTLRNTVCVIVPVCALLYGEFLTHSRGGVLAFLAMAIVAARRRIGTLPALLLAAVLFVAASALHVTGGRDISANAGEDRTDLWSESMQLLKSHPLFGIGFGNLPDYLGHTAHNTILVCAAELGLIGFYFWSLFLFPTLRNALTAASPVQVSDGEPITHAKELLPFQVTKIEQIDKADINNLGRLLVVSLTGFLVAGWFLSRAFVMTFYLLGGMVEVVFEMALQRGMIAPRWPMARVLRFSGGLAIVLLVVMYITLRVVNLMH